MKLEKTVWGYDPRWSRIETFDDDGQPLGVVRFEPNQDRPSPGRTRWPFSPSGVRNRLLAGIASLVAATLALVTTVAVFGS